MWQVFFFFLQPKNKIRQTTKTKRREKLNEKRNKHTRQESYSRYFLRLNFCHNFMSLYDFRPTRLMSLVRLMLLSFDFNLLALLNKTLFWTIKLPVRNLIKIASCNCDIVVDEIIPFIYYKKYIKYHNISCITMFTKLHNST